MELKLGKSWLTSKVTLIVHCTILTINTVANTVGAAGVGAQTHILFGNEWVAVSSGILTLEF